MPKRSRTPTETTKSRHAQKDENQIAFDALQQIIKKTEGSGKNPLAVALGRLGGLKGGRARADKLTGEQRRESARNAARARWSGQK